MTQGKAFEILVKRILMHVGFTEVVSDGLYIFDGAPGQMIQGLGEAHNADVLLQPPVQIPFNAPSRLLIECKNYFKKVGLDILRGALGLREDINNFEVVDSEVMQRRRATGRRQRAQYSYDRYYYQVAVASMNGFTIQAQEFALTHRISLINFSDMPFWSDFTELIGYGREREYGRMRPTRFAGEYHHIDDENVYRFADSIGKNMAVAITPMGQMLFLYSIDGKLGFNDFYTLHWQDTNSLWRLESGENTYLFQLPDRIRNAWLVDMNANKVKESAIYCKANYLANMVVYYFKDYKPTIKMISIDKGALEAAFRNLRN